MCACPTSHTGVSHHVPCAPSLSAFIQCWTLEVCGSLLVLPDNPTVSSMCCDSTLHESYGGNNLRLVSFPSVPSCRRLLSHLASLIFLSIALTLCSTCDAQPTTLEKAALGQILNAYPDLASVPSWEQLTDDNVYYGRSWNKNFAGLCESGDGYDYYGVICKNGHIFGLRVTPYFGRQISSDFSLIPKLVNLRNFTRLVGSDCVELTDAIVSHLPIEHLEIPDSYDWTTNHPESLLYLCTRNSPAINLSRYPNLRHFSTLDQTHTIAELVLDSFYPSIEILELQGPFDVVALVSNMSRFPSLREFSCRNCITTNASIALESSTLTKLLLEVISSNFFFYSPPLTSLNVTSQSLTTILVPSANVSLVTPNLQILVCYGFQPRATTSPLLPQLTSLTMNLFTAYSLKETICPLLQNSIAGITSLSLLSPYDRSVSIPTCFKSSLIRDLTFEGLIIDANSFENIPTAITGFAWSPSAIYGIYHVDLTQFYRFTELKTLSLNGINGSIPEAFFQTMNQLETVQLTSTSLSGNIPSYGWSNLVKVDLRGDFSVWSDIDAAPRLKSLSVTAPLRQRPLDADFTDANLHSLEKFTFASPSYFLRFIPLFWASLPRISQVTIDGNFHGPLPRIISAPRLRSFVSSTTQICGPLPQFAIPTHMDSFIVRYNQLSGSIPTSWEENLTVLQNFRISQNYLNGTFPSRLLNHHTLQLSVDLSDTFFTGPLWNMSKGAPKLLNIRNTNFDVCATPPTPPPGETIVCTVSKVPQCPTAECALAWTAACMDSLSCTPLSNVLPPILSCPMPAPVRPCPMPKPEGFVCRHGQWISKHSLEVASMTLQPNLGNIIVYGNFSSTGPVVFTGSGTTLEVTECILNLENVFMDYANNPVPKRTLIVQRGGSQCPTNLGSVNILNNGGKPKCKIITVSSAESTHSSLIAITSTDSRDCNTRWLVAAGIVGACIILIALSVVLFKQLKLVYLSSHKPSNTSNSQYKLLESTL